MDYQEIIRTLKANLKRIILYSLLFTILIFIYFLLVAPVKYTSQAKILPPRGQQPGGLTNLLQGSSINSFIDMGIPGANSELYGEMLKSRSAANYVVKECNLTDFFGEKDIQHASQVLEDKLNVEITKEGIIKLDLSLETPFFGRFSGKMDSVKIFSARVANTYIDALDKINREKINYKAKKTRQYIDEQIKSTKAKLDSAENRLKDFKERNNTISLPEQVEAAITNAAEIKSQITLAQIKLKTMLLNMEEDSKEIESVKKKINVLREKYNDLLKGKNEDQDYIPYLDEIPKTSMQLAELTREVKIQNEVYLLLQKRYFKEKIEENKNVPTVDVLDEAIPPLKPSSPRLVFHTGLAGIFALCFFSLLVVMLRFRELKQNTNE